MARPWRIRFARAKYHVTVRGNARREVFHEHGDYQRFLTQLDDGLEKDGVILYAYALLSNHFHLFIETPHGNVQRFMQRLNTAYSMFHRFKHVEPGHCFQGRYGAKLVDGDEYITALTRYIHLNPVKTAEFSSRSTEDTRDALRTYPWSSYRGYVNAAHTEERIDYRWLSLMEGAGGAGDRRRYRKYVEAFIGQEDADLRAAMTSNRYAIGSNRFIERVEADLREVQVDRGTYGDIVWPEGKQLTPECVVHTVADAFALTPQDLTSRAYAARMAKKVAMELCCRYCGMSQRQVGEYFGYRGNGAVGKQRQRLRELLDSDRALRRSYRRTEKALAAI